MKVITVYMSICTVSHQCEARAHAYFRRDILNRSPILFCPGRLPRGIRIGFDEKRKKKSFMWRIRESFVTQVLIQVRELAYHGNAIRRTCRKRPKRVTREWSRDRRVKIMAVDRARRQAEVRRCEA
ncbi:hypothetical protein PUN28_015734 [Cardiocondyla obscurior]|uniref:Uncharacterized protein n=1 Tax=Cardiocondyla obscurior TaxID=286306 RepID=A0AAW2EX13_9HYME